VHINPVLAKTNDIDRDFIQMIYSGLLKYDENGSLTPDLAENYEISEDKTSYVFHLKKNILWHDGQPFTAQDVVFTMNIISDPRYKSPLRPTWQGVKASATDDYTVEFKIENAYVGFLNNLTVGILPKHLWEAVEPEKFHLIDYNLEAIGTGPYKFIAPIQKDSDGNLISYKLVANPNYHEGKPFISKITFNFYVNDSAMVDAYNRKEIMGIGHIPTENVKDIKLVQSTEIHTFEMPRYFAVFYNQTKSLPLSDDDVRVALDYATDRKAIVDKILGGYGAPVYSPFLPGMIGYTDDIGKREFNLEKANDILEKKGWIKGSDGIREKNGTKLEINLITIDWESLIKTVEIIKSQWEAIGAKVNVSSYSSSDIEQNYIRPREYEAIFFGQFLSMDPDPYSFWHSTQKKDPGLNLSLFGNAETDKLIDAGNTEFDNGKRAKIYKEFQHKLISEAPATFVYTSDYIYPVTKSIKGINNKILVSPSNRYSLINKWYIKTKRVWREK
jgi:peptide/nickel transport system substrate-binding protein